MKVNQARLSPMEKADSIASSHGLSKFAENRINYQQLQLTSAQTSGCRLGLPEIPLVRNKTEPELGARWRTPIPHFRLPSNPNHSALRHGFWGKRFEIGSLYIALAVPELTIKTGSNSNRDLPASAF